MESTFVFLSTHALGVMVTLITLVLILLGVVAHLSWRLSRFMRGANGTTLESTMAHIVKTHEDSVKNREHVESRLNNLHDRLTRAARGIATIRYNALSGDTSGKQSFATAIVTEEGNGVVISSMHSRNATRVYAKPVAQFASEHELSEEEVAAINASKSQCKM